MGSLKNELKNIVGYVLLSYHGDLSSVAFIIHYGKEKFIITAIEILELCLDSNIQLSKQRLLDESEPIDDTFSKRALGIIRLLDSTQNKVVQFEVDNNSNRNYKINKVIYNNLLMIDGDMPKILSEITNIVAKEMNVTSSEILEKIISSNPLNIDKDRLDILYRYKIGRLLYNFALGVTGEKAWDGKTQNGGIIFMEARDSKGFNFYNQTDLANYLLESTEFRMNGSQVSIKISNTL